MADIAIAILVETGEAEACHAQRHIHTRIHPDAVVIAIAGGDICAEFITRLAHDEIYRAACGIAAIQGALRATQHFHTFKIEQRDAQCGGRINVFAIDIGDDRVVLRTTRRVTHAAERYLDGALILLDHRDRRHLAQVVGIGKACIGEFGSTDHVDLDRHILLVLHAVLRGHDNDVLSAGICSSILRRDRHRNGGKCATGQQQATAGEFHL